jgi:hypothetical protein
MAHIQNQGSLGNIAALIRRQGHRMNLIHLTGALNLACKLHQRASSAPAAPTAAQPSSGSEAEQPALPEGSGSPPPPVAGEAAAVDDASLQQVADKLSALLLSKLRKVGWVRGSQLANTCWAQCQARVSPGAFSPARCSSRPGSHSAQGWGQPTPHMRWRHHARPRRPPAACRGPRWTSGLQLRCCTRAGAWCT